MANVTKESDLKLEVSFYDCEGILTPVETNPFEIRYYTTNISSSVICSYIGGTFSSNCKVDPLDDTKLICMLNQPCFTPGNLLARITVYYTDVDFPDGDYKKVKVFSTNTTITD